LIRELAEFERLADQVVLTPELLRESLFGEEPPARALVATMGGETVGYAIYFFNFSTFLGRAGLYIEDIYVRPTARGTGVGTAMINHLAKIAAGRNCGRMEWSVLDWNAKARQFYESLGAKPMTEWLIYRLDQEAIGAVARR